MEWFDEVDAVELTDYTREIIEAADQAPGTLSDILPNDQVDDLNVYWTEHETVNLLGQVRSYDTETPIGSGAGEGEQRMAMLPPVGLKQRFSEYDQLRARRATSEENVQAAAERKAREVGVATLSRVILMRGEALQTGRLHFAENGVRQKVEFDRRTDFTVTAEALWGVEGTDPIEFLETLVEKFIEENDNSMPNFLVGSRKAGNALRQRMVEAGYFGEPSKALLVKNSDVNELLTDRSVPAFTINDATRAGRRILDADKIIMGTTGGVAGQTIWGTPLEAYEAEYSQMDPANAPGLLLGAYKQNDPSVKWIRATGIAMPVLANPNATMCAKVL